VGAFSFVAIRERERGKGRRVVGRVGRKVGEVL
jgi:hypothetical protein